MDVRTLPRSHRARLHGIASVLACCAFHSSAAVRAAASSEDRLLIDLPCAHPTWSWHGTQRIHSVREVDVFSTTRDEPVRALAIASGKTLQFLRLLDGVPLLPAPLEFAAPVQLSAPIDWIPYAVDAPPARSICAWNAQEIFLITLREPLNDRLHPLTSRARFGTDADPETFTRLLDVIADSGYVLALWSDGVLQNESPLLPQCVRFCELPSPAAGKLWAEGNLLYYGYMQTDGFAVECRAWPFCRTTSAGAWVAEGMPLIARRIGTGLTLAFADRIIVLKPRLASGSDLDLEELVRCERRFDPAVGIRSALVDAHAEGEQCLLALVEQGTRLRMLHVPTLEDRWNAPLRFEPEQLTIDPDGVIVMSQAHYAIYDLQDGRMVVSGRRRELAHRACHQRGYVISGRDVFGFGSADLR